MLKNIGLSNYIQYIFTQTNIPSLYNLPGQKFIKFFGGVLENIKNKKRHSEINWPRLVKAASLIEPAIKIYPNLKVHVDLLKTYWFLRAGMIRFNFNWHRIEISELLNLLFRNCQINIGRSVYMPYFNYLIFDQLRNLANLALRPYNLNPIPTTHGLNQPI